jgi:hypothetical protein
MVLPRCLVQALLSEEELLLADDEAALRRQEGALAEDLTALEGLMERGRQEEGRLEEARRAIRQEREVRGVACLALASEGP